MYAPFELIIYKRGVGLLLCLAELLGSTAAVT